MSDKKKYLAELPGTFVLVLTGTGSAVVAGKEIGVPGIALALACQSLLWCEPSARFQDVTSILQ
jgi:glycerol uptake facilitator-like aquaporin